MKKNLLALGVMMLGLGAFAQTPRLSLFEEFTGETCPPCASTNPGLNALLLSPTNASKIIAIKWQVPIPSAPTKPWSLYLTNKAEIDWRYKAPTAGYGYASQANSGAAVTSQGVNSAPSGRIDGQHQWAFGAASDHPANMSNAVIATAQSFTSAFSITMTRAWNKTCTAVTLTVDIQATAPFTAVGPLIFRTVMVERLIQFTVQPGTNGETKFEDVAIKSFPSIQAGMPLPANWTLGQTHSFTLTCPIPTYVRDKEEIAMVGFIQDDGNKKVAQACRADKTSLPPDALAGIAAKVDPGCSSSITPTVTVQNDGTLNAITALTITPYVDGVVGAPTFWTGNIALGAFENIPLNTLTTSTLTGLHTFSCDIEMNSPVYNMTKNATKISYMIASDFPGETVAEGFVMGAYPPTGFALINNDAGPSWTRVINAGAYNIAPLQSTKYDFFANTNIGDKDEMYLPPVNLAVATDAMLTFDRANAQRTSTSSNDALDVMISGNCGLTWTTVYSASGSALATAPPSNTSYFPDPNDAAQWVTETIDLSTYTSPTTLIKFVTTSDNGNNLYLDNINLAFKTTGIKTNTSAEANVTLYPNPTNATAHVKIVAPTAGDAKITVVNTLGQVVFTKQLSLGQGTNTLSIDTKEYAAGIYNVTIDSKSGLVTKKLTVTK